MLPLERDPTNPHDIGQVRCSCKEMWRNCWPFNVAPVVSAFLSRLEAVQTFLDSKGHSEEATRVASTMDRVAYFHISTLNFARQSTLEEFFPPV